MKIMNETMKNENEYVGYEYKELSVSRDLESLYADSYPQFGWSFEGEGEERGGINKVVLKFKRNRKLKNKAELVRLQRQFENFASEVDSLKKSKTTKATVVAFTTGVVGSAFMALSVFSYLGGNLPLCVVFAIPAFIGWIIPYFAYKTILKNKSVKINPQIEQRYDEIDEICSKASVLI